MIDDDWLSDLLQQRTGVLTDPEAARETAAALVEHGVAWTGAGW